VNSLFCEACPKALKEYYTKDNKNYCPECYDIIHSTQCVVCLKYPRSSLFDSFWKIGYCSEHGEVQQCCGCRRPRSNVARFADLPDCGCICADCGESAIVTNENALTLFYRVSEFWASKGLTLSQSVPVYTVGKTKMQSIKKEEKIHETRTIGLTFSNKSVVTRFLVSKSERDVYSSVFQPEKEMVSTVVDIQTTRHVQGKL